MINDGGTHNLFIEGYDERTYVVSAGATQVMNFVADKAGMFSMWSEVGSHKDMGMTWQFIVK